MPSPLRPLLDSICRAAIEAVDAEACTRRRLELDGERLLGSGPVRLLAVGKAAVPMAKAARDFVGPRLSDALAVTKDGHGDSLEGVDVLETAHPEPDARGVEAARRVLDRLNAPFQPNSRLLVLVSGGASALLPAPVEGVTLADKQAATRALLRSGANIHEINTIRKHLSALKGGRLVEAAGDIPIVGLFLSDVVGDDFSSIGSGLTAPDPTSFDDCLEIIDRYRLGDELPAAVKTVLGRGSRGELPETPGDGDPCFDRVTNLLVGNNYQALQAAATAARRLMFEPLILTSYLEGPTSAAAAHLVAIARQILDTGEPVTPPCCLIAGGETTVQVTGQGKGGRNMELALQCVPMIAGWADRLLIASIGTDGTDGPTDAAGALATPDSAARAAALGLSPAEALADNDSYPFFQALGDLVVTGPTLTNVMDIQLVLVGRGE